MITSFRPIIISRKNENMADVPAWYSGRHVLITGATGFMGKTLVEKLLRCCPNIGAIYIVIRSKKGRTSQQRLEDLWNSPIFDELRDASNAEDIFRKLICLNGDVTSNNLNITEKEVENLINNVEVVFHMAANVRFDLPLKPAVLMNIGGTLNVLELACKFLKLKVFLHTSTSYCHCDRTHLEEKLYPAPHKPRDILQIVKWMDGDLLNTITPTLLGDSPNTYAYTKCLSEELVSEYSTKLPLVICRPSIVVGAWKEPIPGWVDNLNGPTGIMVGAGKGLIRTMHCNPELVADVIPVDIGVNSLLLAAYNIGHNLKSDHVEVYHVTANPKYASTWGKLLGTGRQLYYDIPFSVCLWYPGGDIRSSYVWHTIAAFLFHQLPAYFVDFLLYLFNQKPFLVQLQKRIQNGLHMLQYYTTRSWYFCNTKLYRIYEELSEHDQQMFYLENQKIIDTEYLKNYILGARKYCVHEEPETIPYARKKLKRLYYLDLMVNLVVISLLIWGFYFVVFHHKEDVNCSKKLNTTMPGIKNVVLAGNGSN